MNQDDPKTFYQGRTALARGDSESAQRYFAATLPALEGAMRKDPDDPDRHATLGLLYAYMNRKADAIREGRRAVELEPESKNAFHGAGWAANLALVYALVGEQEQAITLIERLLSTPGPVGATVGCYLEHHTVRTASALGVGLAPQQSALPEDPRRTGAEDDLLGATGECHTRRREAWISNRSCSLFEVLLYVGESRRKPSYKAIIH